jgi:hypothetical protein
MIPSQSGPKTPEVVNLKEGVPVRRRALGPKWAGFRRGSLFCIEVEPAFRE